MAALVEPGPDFWAGTRVLLTGQTGFKGAWLWLWLKHLGAAPFGLALPPDPKPSLFELAGIGDGLDEALAWTVDWHRRHLAGDAAGRLVLDQIRAYEEIVGGVLRMDETEPAT